MIYIFSISNWHDFEKENVYSFLIWSELTFSKNDGNVKFTIFMESTLFCTTIQTFLLFELVS